MSGRLPCGAMTPRALQHPAGWRRDGSGANVETISPASSPVVGQFEVKSVSEAVNVRFIHVDPEMIDRPIAGWVTEIGDRVDDVLLGKVQRVERRCTDPLKSRIGE